MLKTTFLIKKMDCPSEENLIRMSLEDISGIEHLEFDIDQRVLHVFHSSPVETINKKLQSLKLGSELQESNETKKVEFDSEGNDRKLLWSVLLINFSFFVIEGVFGLLSDSMGLVADGFDMLADSLVYGISLLAVGASKTRKLITARIAGLFQLSLAVFGFIEVLRRVFFSDEIPNYETMIIVSLFALGANYWCLYLLKKSKSEEVHMKASMIFTSNDIIINIGVILAGISVALLNNKIPDLVIGIIVFSIVIRGAIRILKLSK